MDIVLSNFEAIGIAEGFIHCENQDRYWAAWQHIIDKRLDVALQGWFANTTRTLIEEGVCKPPPKIKFEAKNELLTNA